MLYILFTYKLYNGIERNPNAAGSGLIKFGCSAPCMTDCINSTFEFWNKNIEDFELDPCLTIACKDVGND